MFFVVRHNQQWTKPVVIRQNDKMGSEHDGNLNLYFSYSNSKVESSGLDLSRYVSDFTDFPLIEE